MLDIEVPEDELENQLNKGALWAITYGDLMSYLMLFFLIMFSFSLSNKGLDFVKSLSEVQKAAGGSESKELIEKQTAKEKEDTVAGQIEERFKAMSPEAPFGKVEMTEEKIKITLREGVLFDSADVNLRPEAKIVLHEVAQFVGNMPNRIIIEGHTDNTPVPKGSKFVSNWVISMARAYKVLLYFTQEEGIAQERFACMGYGEHQPVADNNDPDGRAQNRRIEITLLRK